MTAPEFGLPQGRVFDFDTCDLRIAAGSHPHEAPNQAAIDAHWAVETGRNPALFDGRMILFAGLHLRGSRLQGLGHEVRYASFMHWRSHGGENAIHCFAHAVLAGSDGALLAVRMGRHTANAGKVYFAAGSFEPADVRDGRIDVESNMRREVIEETGLDLTQASAEPGWHGWSRGGHTVIFRRYTFAKPCDLLARQVEAFVATQAEPEIEGPVIIRSPQDLPADTAAHMGPLVAWHFGTAGPSQQSA